jgi:hypothetical protein
MPLIKCRIRRPPDLRIVIQYNTIYYARRPVLTERALVANAYIQRLLFVLVSPSPCCATHCSICIRIFLRQLIGTHRP